jgi:DNA mismatch repair protein MutS
LGNNAIAQLNIIDNNGLESYDNNYKSLFDVVNQTQTAVGKRFLRESLCNPFSALESHRMISRYDIIDQLIKLKELNEIKCTVGKIKDVERLHRKMAIRSLHPFEFYGLYQSYQCIMKVYALVGENQIIKNYFFKSGLLNKINQFQSEISQSFLIEDLNLYSYNKITGRIYQEGAHKDLDKLIEIINEPYEELHMIVDLFEGFIMKGCSSTSSDNTSSDNTSSKLSLQKKNSGSKSNARGVSSESKSKKTKKAKKTSEESDDESEEERGCGIRVESTETEGFNITVRKPKGDIIKDRLAKMKSVTLKLSTGVKITYNYSDFTFKNLKDKYRISVPKFSLLYRKNFEALEKLKILSLRYYFNDLDRIYLAYSDLLSELVKLVGEFDFLLSGALVAKDYKYCRPVIKKNEESNEESNEDSNEESDEESNEDSDEESNKESNEESNEESDEESNEESDEESNEESENESGDKSDRGSYVKFKELRHPLIERINKETEYIPNDMELGNINNSNGVLLYGLNSSGKTSHMKAIGCSVILAQMGYFVPAKEFIFEPYMALYARITGNDNILKGQSSYDLELDELNAIFTRINSAKDAGLRTLVIGDEICRGTEIISAISIVASTIVSLAASSTSFIFATHFHEVAKLDLIKDLPNVKTFHLKAEYDSVKKCIVYERKLLPGNGPEDYGLLVAEHKIKGNKNFIKYAEQVKNKLMYNFNNGASLNNLTPDVVLSNINMTKGNYNKSLIKSACDICKKIPKGDEKELEVHHINFQKDCNKEGYILGKEYLHKNHLSNLVVLCRKCHNSVHQGEIKIMGYDDTTDGKILNYTRLATNKPFKV